MGRGRRAEGELQEDSVGHHPWASQVGHKDKMGGRGRQCSRRVCLISSRFMALYQFWGAAVDPGQALECLGLYFVGWRTHRHGVLTWVPREKLAGMSSQESKLVPHLSSSLGRGGTSIVTLGTHQWFHRR